MRIEKIHITGFGKLHDISLDFENGFNLVFGDNEDGKTTIMYFIRLMFYGTTSTKSDINANLRKRYSPFDGGMMGGTIEFSHGGKRYSLSKEFKTSARTDRTVLTDLSLGQQVSVPAGKEIGELFFSLGSAAFERSIFIGQFVSDDKSGTDEFSQKLAATVYSGDSDSYEQIRGRINSAIQSLHTPRRVGITDKLEAHIAELSDELCGSENIEEKRLEKTLQLKSVEDRISLLQKNRDRLSKIIAQNKSATRKKLLEDELLTRKKRQRALCSLGGITAESLDSAERLLRELDMAKAQQSAAVSVDTEALTPNTDIAGALIKAMDEAEKAKSKTQDAENALQNADREAALLEAKISANKNKKNGTVFFAFAAAVAVLSAVLAFVFLPLLSLLAVAAAFLFLGIRAGRNLTDDGTELLDIKSKAVTLREAAAAARAELLEAESRKNALEARKKLYEESAENRREIQKKEAERKNALAVSIKELESGLCRLLLTDTLPQNPQDTLKSLHDFCAVVSLCDGILQKSEFASLDDKTVENELDSLPDTIAPTTDTADSERLLNELSPELEQLTVTATRLRTEIPAMFGGYREVAIIENELREAQNELARQKDYMAVLDLCGKTLDEAYSEMRGNFAPELNRLTAEIFSGLTKEKYDSVVISSDFNISVRERGTVTPYDSAYLSGGAQDQIYLALRLALSTLIGGENDLPLILDDPFIQYDDRRTEIGMQFLSQYAADHQVLFFTCHGSIKDGAAEHGIKPLSLKN